MIAVYDMQKQYDENNRRIHDFFEYIANNFDPSEYGLKAASIKHAGFVYDCMVLCGYSFKVSSTIRCNIALQDLPYGSTTADWVYCVYDIDNLEPREGCNNSIEVALAEISDKFEEYCKILSQRPNSTGSLT
jgi:hypothetical protein